MTGKNSWLGLEAKRVIVTGAGSGIGRSVALAFAEAGAKVCPLDQNAAAAEETAHLVEQVGRSAGPYFAVDVSDQESLNRAFTALARDWASIDVVANVAGVLRAGGLDSLSPADWELTLNVNLTGAFFVSQSARRQMTAGGALVHVASIAGSQPQGFSGAYSPAKAGLLMLSRQLAFEWGPAGIRSNVVSPGLVRTPMSEAFYEAPGVLAAREAVVPARRIAGSEDMSNVILFLASNRSSYISGQEIVVDGGFSQTLMSHVPRPGFEDQ